MDPASEEQSTAGAVSAQLRAKLMKLACVQYPEIREVLDETAVGPVVRRELSGPERINENATRYVVAAEEDARSTPGGIRVADDGLSLFQQRRDSFYTPAWPAHFLPSTPWVKGFVLDNFLSADECASLLVGAERGMESVAGLYPADRRRHERAIAFSRPLADALYERLLPHIRREDVVGMSPIGFGRAGIWRPHRLNQCIKFNKYDSSSVFQAHRDGPWTPRAEEASIYTVIIYLSPADNLHTLSAPHGPGEGPRRRPSHHLSWPRREASEHVAAVGERGVLDSKDGSPVVCYRDREMRELFSWKLESGTPVVVLAQPAGVITQWCDKHGVPEVADTLTYHGLHAIAEIALLSDAQLESLCGGFAKATGARLKIAVQSLRQSNQRSQQPSVEDPGSDWFSPREELPRPRYQVRLLQQDEAKAKPFWIAAENLLQETLVGGETEFLLAMPDCRSSCFNRDDQISLRVPPLQGRAVIFDHRVWHRHAKIETGTKVILRTELIFRREHAPTWHMDWNDAAYVAARRHYAASRAAEARGDAAAFSSEYEAVLDAQIRAGEESRAPDEVGGWRELFLELASDPHAAQMLAAVAASCRSLWFMAQDSEVWRELYRKRWAGARLEAAATAMHVDDPTQDAAVRDWKNLYRQRLHASQVFDPIIIALDAAEVHAQSCSGFRASAPSGLQKVFALHMNMPEHERFQIGKPGERAYYTHMNHDGKVLRVVDQGGTPITSKDDDGFELLTANIRMALGKLDPFLHPLVFIERPLDPAPFRNAAMRAAFEKLRAPAVGFCSPFRAALYARDRAAGVVVLLPAARARPEDPAEHAFVAAVRAAAGAAAPAEEARLVDADVESVAAAIRSLVPADAAAAADLLSSVVLSQRGAGWRGTPPEEIDPETGEGDDPRRVAVFTAEDLQRELDLATPRATVLPVEVDDVLRGGAIFASLSTFRQQHCVFRP